MNRKDMPFALPRSLPTRLGQTLAHWRGLLRGGAETPFADDVSVSELRALAEDVVLLGVFQRPQRFRLDLAYAPDAPMIESDLLDRFVDEADLPAPLAFLQAQAAATVEALAPTYYERKSRGGEPGFGRLLLPAWGEGRVSLIVCALQILRS